MYLYTRMMKLAHGHVQDGIEWAVDITGKVNQVTSLNVGLWVPTLSPGLGRLSFGAAVEHLTDLEDAQAKLNVDAMFLDAVQRGAEVTEASVDDQVAQFVHMPAIDFEPSYVAVVLSQLANGNFQRGVAAGIEIATQATAISGLPTAFLVGTTGAYGGCGWITSGRSLKEVEEGEQAVNASLDFIGLVDRESVCYLPGATTQTIWQRIV